jgi:hypothetical protein
MSLAAHAAPQWRRHDTHRREQFRRHRVIAVGSFRAGLLQIVARRGDAMVSEARKKRDVKRCEVFRPISEMPKEARHDWIEFRAVAETEVVDQPS